MDARWSVLPYYFGGYDAAFERSAREEFSAAIIGRHLVHFAGHDRHVGFYPGPSGIAAFQEELKPYKSAEGSVRFHLDRPMPEDLIRRMVEFRVRESAAAPR